MASHLLDGASEACAESEKGGEAAHVLRLHAPQQQLAQGAHGVGHLCAKGGESSVGVRVRVSVRLGVGVRVGVRVRVRVKVEDAG